MPSYIDLCHEITTLGRSCDITAVLAVSAVVSCPVSTFWPPLGGSLYRSPLSQFLVGHGVDQAIDSQHRAVDLLWTTTDNVKPEVRYEILYPMNCDLRFSGRPLFISTRASEPRHLLQTRHLFGTRRLIQVLHQLLLLSCKIFIPIQKPHSPYIH